ncbi:MAG: pimeloyl-ACP methyl ester carboxylesterase [Myxococcota bacterium]
MDRRETGLLAAAAGAGVAAVVARQAVSRARRRVEAQAAPPLRSEPRVVRTPDGVDLHVEVDELDPGVELPVGAATLVFVHGFAMSQDCWHYQRAQLRGTRRIVLFDHRSHGRSSLSDVAYLTIDQLGRDLLQVLDEVAPGERVVLVGHSMGGMTIMSLAEQHPELFGDRVVGVALLATAAGGIATMSVLAPIVPHQLTEAIKPRLTQLLKRLAPAVDESRKRLPNAMFLAARAVAMGEHASAEKVALVARDVGIVPAAVVLDMAATFDDHNRYRALATIGQVPSLVVSGSRDLITPARHSRELHEQIPGSRLLALDGPGHCVMIERDRQVNTAIQQLLVDADEDRA